MSTRSFDHWSYLGALTLPYLKDRTSEQGVGMKPKGLWISDPFGEYDWWEWNEDEQFFDLTKQTHHKVWVDMTDILVLSSLSEIEGLGAKFPADKPKELSEYFVDWRKVARDFKGILITPYNWDARWSSVSPWYNGWDCASGCIWNTSAIVSLRPTATEKYMFRA